MRYLIYALLIVMSSTCINADSPKLKYYEVGMKSKPAEWKDSSFVVATSNPTLIAAV